MTANEIIRTLRCCADHDIEGCRTCSKWVEEDCEHDLLTRAADAIETLLEFHRENQDNVDFAAGYIERLHQAIEEECNLEQTEVPGDEATISAQNDREEIIKKYRTSDRWIRVAEQLPDPCKDVLVYYKNGTVRIACYYFLYRDNVGWFDYESLYGKATHWMPLPAGPAEADA